MENWREELNTILEGIDEEETHNEKGWWETSLGAEFGREVKVLIIKLIEQELDKAREEGRKSAIHEISKTLDTEVTRWRSDEDGEFDVLRIGFRYFRSTDVDDYSSSIEAVSEEDFEDYESI